MDFRYKPMESGGMLGGNRTPHPYFTAFHEVVKNRKDITKIANSIIKESRNHRRDGTFMNSYDLESIITSDQLADQKQKFMAMMRGVVEGEKQRPCFPEPPKVDMLSSKLDPTAEYVEIGSGNMHRTRTMKVHAKVISSDVVEHKDLDHVACASEVLQLYPEHTFITFNVLTQLPKKVLDQVVEKDGVHVVPDLEKSLELGVSQIVNEATERNIRTMGSKNKKVYMETQVDLPGVGINTTYKLCNTYKSIQTGSCTVGDWEEGDYIPERHKDQHLVTTDLYSNDVSPKIDGEFVEIEYNAKTNEGFVTRRNGKYKRFSYVDDPPPSYCLHAEMTENHYIITRISYYKNFRPYHSGPTIRYFSSRVKIKLDKIVEPTPDINAMPQFYEDEGITSDGIVKRRNQADYFVKDNYTVDLNYVPEFQEYCTQKGFTAVFQDGPPSKGLKEYKFDEKVDDILYFTYVRDRPDKLRSTPFKEILKNIEAIMQERT